MNMERIWFTAKRWMVAVVACVLTIGLVGCSLDDVFSPLNFDDIPFEEQQTAPTDLGVVDNRPGIPEDPDFDDLRQDPV